MSRQTELALLSLMPAHGSELPPSLVELASSLLAQSRNRASTLKADEEVARHYACANIACERLKISLNLPPIEPRPPIPPRIYKRLYTHLDNILPNPSATPRASRTRAGGPTNSPVTSSRPLPSRGTPSRESALSQFRTPSKPVRQSATRPTGKEDGSGLSGTTLPPWVQAVARFLCNETDNAKFAPSVLAGIEFIQASRGQTPNQDDWVKSHATDLVAAIFFFVVTRVRALASDATIDREGYIPLRKEIISQLIRARSEVEASDADESVFWRGWRSLKAKDFDAAVSYINGQEWLNGDWYEGIADIVNMTPGADLDAAASVDRGSEDSVPTRRADTMFQDKYDFLSEARRTEYSAWKVKILARIDQAMETSS
ncbi:hypothetical protein HIM_00312 [Hirsutella minnesotensis 3608]|nr:hypothetical protein HIM_00312 [Hirsutella minnesotensis 3608]